ncbi:MAG: hypothetical protein HZA62_08235 [Rhodocyclales bacterium]|nr:hypothetical protein [Rhodocyclales bacterium]
MTAGDFDRMRSRRNLAVSMAAMACLLRVAPVLAQPSQDRLGTLFYSPVERAMIVASRKGDGYEGEGVSAHVSLTGVVSRDGRKGTAWINGRPVKEGEAISSAGVPVIAAGRVVIDGKQMRVRETLELESGARSDALPAGAVSIRRSK